MAASNGWSFFTPLFSTFDDATRSYVTDISTKMIAAITPVISVGLTLGFLVYSLAVIRGTVQMPISDLLWRCFRIGVIVSIATAGGLYQTTLADVIISTPDALAKALVGSTEGSTSIGETLDQAAQHAVTVAAKQWEKASVFSKQGVMYVVYSMLIMVSSAVMLSVGGAFMILAKIALALLVGMGPLFIFMLLWEPTKDYFNKWVGQIVNYGLLIVLFSIMFTFLMGIYGNYMANVNSDSGTMNAIYNLMGALAISGISILILLQLPSIASALSGGLNLGYMREASAAKNGAKSAMRGARSAGRVAAAGGRAAMTGGRMAMAGAGAAGKAIAAFARGSMK
ncbi:type IV secretion system protein [Kerstersia gyiorum]|uniref:type IV secretion system protein n=1 Tax=Kerstersia gyiorum TaxID=206506 RepID=UPI0020A1DE40|nr:type IV secretion system protein [Kerstersia gyiorum]MCP1672883.1 type IV secretion system protein VirB6 [Kerstersia gyiorum]MCP1710782.1 type IV secretion system protein VirB6 [Kerstersia gyiorum]